MVEWGEGWDIIVQNIRCSAGFLFMCCHMLRAPTPYCRSVRLVELMEQWARSVDGFMFIRVITQ